MNIKKTAVKSALAVAAAAAALTTNVSAKDFSGAELYTLEEGGSLHCMSKHESE